MFGLYGACSTSGEALALAGMSAAAGYGKYMLAVTSSHFGSAEKEFRFPLGYANQRPLSAHWTVTGSGAFLVRAADATTPGTSTANNPAANVPTARQQICRKLQQHLRPKMTSAPLMSLMFVSQG